jgi:hypothetical protein
VKYKPKSAPIAENKKHPSIMVDIPDIKSCPIHDEQITTIIPMSGCNKRNKIATDTLAPDNTIPGNFRSLYCSVISHALVTAKIGLKNSDGCIENPKKLSHRLAPFISLPIMIVRTTRTRHPKYPVTDNRFI